MCMLCYELAPEEHWADGGPFDQPSEEARSGRHRRTRLISAVLAPFGLTVTDAGAGPHRMLADRKGRAEIAAGLPSLWQAADQLSSRPIDVLDPALLQSLEQRGA